jgi:hypothetical protein
MAVVGGLDQSMGLFTLVQNEGAQRETKYAVPEVWRPLPQDESKDRQVQREPNAQNRQHGRHGHLTIFEGLGFPLGSAGTGRRPAPFILRRVARVVTPRSAQSKGPVPTHTQLHQLTTVKTYFNSLSE